MAFLDSYKRLDNLCKDLFNSNVGVSSYIAEMEGLQFYASRIDGWDRDYQKLKRYRYIRNQIVHENWASESNLCSQSDCAWLESFYQRILNGADPISVQHRLREERTPKGHRPGQAEAASSKAEAAGKRTDRAPEQSERHPFSLLAWLVIALAAAFFLIYVLSR